MGKWGVRATVLGVRVSMAVSVRVVVVCLAVTLHHLLLPVFVVRQISLLLQQTFLQVRRARAREEEGEGEGEGEGNLSLGIKRVEVSARVRRR